MDIRKRRIRGYFALSVLMIVCLIMGSATIFFALGGNARVSAASSFIEVDELLISGYESKPQNSNIFDSDSLADLYEKLTGNSNSTITDVKNLGTKDASYFRDLPANGGKDIIVNLGGKKWNVAYLTQANGDVILDLWLDASNAARNKWNDTTVVGTVVPGTYPANMYGVSKMRAVVLNNGGQYFIDQDTLTSNYTPVASNTFAIFTMPYSASFTASIRDYIVQPKDIAYQATENSYGITLVTPTHGNYTRNNEAYEKITSGAHWYTNGSGITYCYEDRANYSNWKDDYIWLPSTAEVGNGDGVNGIWKLSFEQKKSLAVSSWLRTAREVNAPGVHIITGNTVAINAADVVTELGTRPAFHLNLSKVADHASKKVALPEDLEKDYDGSEQGVEGEQWYIDADLANNATVTYYDKKTSSVLTTKPKNVGNYEVEIKLNSDDHYWEDNVNKSAIKINFDIIKKIIPYPKFIDGENKLPYNGGQDVYFQLETFEDYKKYINIQVPSKYGTDVKYNDVSQSFTAKEVDTYEMDVTLTDTNNTEWETGTHKLQFEIEKAKVGISITDNNNSSSLSGAKGDTLNVNLDLDHNKIPHSGKSVNVTIWASADRLPTVNISVTMVLTDANMSYALDLDLSNLRAGVQYKLEARTDSGDYEIELETATVDVTEAPARVVLTWELYSDGSKVRNVYKDKLLSDADKTTALDNAITYDGKAYALKAKLPNGYSLDTSQGIGGYKVEYANTGNSNVGTNADKYTTTIWLKNNADSSVEEYSITWEIEKAKYDLSQVKWKYDGKLPYDKLNGSKAELDSKTMPEGLLAEYTNNTGANVGDYGTAYVTFKLDSGYEENYILPDEYDPETYEDSNREFEWTKTWNIVKARIQTGSWKNATQTDSNGNAFDIKVLRDPLAEGGIVTYEYYETDATGKKINDTALKAEDIVYSDSEVKFYVAKPILVDANNYELDDNNAESRWFKVGRALTKVTVALESNELEYNTNPRHVKLTVGGESVLPTSAFDVTYYEGYTRLNDAPKEVGKYRVEVSLKSEYADKYEIDGEYDFEFEIVRGKIAIDWNTQAKPNVLNLKYGQINGVEYEIVDGEDNVVDYKDLQAGKTYRIRAKIKEGEKNHFIFEDGSVITDWQEFSVSANDKLTDPNDPKNPYYPQVDPDMPTDNGSDPTDPSEETKNDFEKVIEVLKEWWQVIASAISIILILIFVAKGIGYANKRKENKRAIESKYNTFYAVSGTGLFGLSMTNWTIIACVLMGLAVLSFVFMLVEKCGYKKSQKELESAKEEYEGNQKDIENRKRVEENQRRDEDMKMILMSMLGGQANMNGGSGQSQGGYAYAQPSVSAEEMRLMINEAVTALLPNVQQSLPQQASSNDETVEKLNKTVEDLKNVVEKMIEGSVSNQIEKQYTAKTVEKIVEVDRNNEKIDLLMRNQEKLMEKILELSANQSSEPQVIEKVVEKEVPVEVEKVVEKVVEVPVEKIVEKEVVKEVKVEVPVEVEKIVEVPVEVEKVVEKIVEIPAEKPATKVKVTAPRLTLDEAYERLSAKQKKIFDTLKAYAMSKDKCKEKKSTYYIVLGQSSVNPLVKLTIKKDTTVALFKMEDEYFKDIRRNATNDGTKVKVKESELIVADMQALATAKEMVDLREDQIERYNEYLKEQRSMKK